MGLAAFNRARERRAKEEAEAAATVEQPVEEAPQAEPKGKKIRKGRKPATEVAENATIEPTVPAGGGDKETTLLDLMEGNGGEKSGGDGMADVQS